jgi:hypothetical protein
MPTKKIKNMKKKRTKKPEYLIYSIGLTILVIVVVIFAVFYSLDTSKPKETTTTSTIVTTMPTTSVVTTTVLMAQTCSNFTWNVKDMDMLDLVGDYRILTVDFNAQYVGVREENYYVGSYKFKILDDSGRYYNSQEAYRYCDYPNRFKMRIVKPGDRISGCMAFSVLDSTEPKKLVFYDYIYNTMCEIDLS